MKDILFSDEYRFCLSFGDKLERFYRRRGDRFSDICVRQSNQFGGELHGLRRNFILPSYPVISVHGNITGQRYIGEILGPVAWPYITDNRRAMTLQHSLLSPFLI